MPELAKSPSTGKWNEYDPESNVWREITGPTPDDYAAVEQYRNESPGLGIGQGVMNMLGGDYWAPSLLGMSDNEYQASKQMQREDTPLSVLGGEIGTGVAGAWAAGPSALAQIGTSTAFGAAIDSENPLRGAALGFALGSAVPVGMAAYGARGALPGLGQRAAKAAEVAASATPMTQRILSRIMPRGVGAADDGAERALSGFLTPEEAADLNLPLTYGDERALLARAGTDDLEQADRLRRAEALRETDEITGGAVRSVRSQQKDWATNQVKQRMGMATQSNITGEELSKHLNRLGAGYEAKAAQIGSIPLDDGFNAGLDAVMSQVDETSGWRNALSNIAQEARDMAARNDGSLLGSDWQQLNTKLGKMIESGGKQGARGKVSDAVDMQQVFLDNMERWLPASVQEEFRTLNTQYALTKTLLKNKGHLSLDGRVNSTSLHNSLKTSGRLRGRQADSLLRLLETDAYLTAPVAGNSFTAERLLANPVRTGIQAGMGAGLAGGAAAGLNTLLGD